MNLYTLDDLNRILSAKYQVLGELGRGGMAVVYQVRNLALNRVEALKVLPPDFARDEELVRRFLHEARTAGQLSHPAVVTIYDVGQAQGVNYFTMEYLKGETLAERLGRDGALSSDEAAHIAEEVCEALNYAHAQGVIHRDIKPENIMAQAGGRVVVMDFGIARAAQGTQMTTRLGLTLGTPHYMSPEQALGKKVDERSDLYSLGVVLYYLATGRVPFQAEDTTAIIYQQVHEPPPPPRAVNPRVPLWLNNAILKALAKDPQARFQSAEAMRQTLERREEVEVEPLRKEPGKTQVFASVPSRGPGEERKVNWLKWAMGVLGVALVGVVIWGVMSWQEEQRQAELARQVAEQQMVEAARQAEEQRQREERARAEAVRRAEAERLAAERTEAARREEEQRRREGVVVELLGGVQMEFVWIAPGTFQMGSPSPERGRFGGEVPQHRVTISRGFWLGKYELTQEQWEAVMGTRPWSGQEFVQVNPNHPAVNISWDDVQEFIRRLNAAAGEQMYRLPTEAEWEYACRAGTTTRWSFGGDESRLKEYAWYEQNAWNVGEKYGHRVGTKKPNPWGLYDLHGNVWEWCQDWVGDYLSSQTDPTGPASGSGRVIRGGSFHFGALYTRSAYLRGSSPDDSHYGIGARLLRTK